MTRVPLNPPSGPTGGPASSLAVTSPLTQPPADGFQSQETKKKKNNYTVASSTGCSHALFDFLCDGLPFICFSVYTCFCFCLYVFLFHYLSLFFLLSSAPKKYHLILISIHGPKKKAFIVATLFKFLVIG